VSPCLLTITNPFVACPVFPLLDSSGEVSVLVVLTDPTEARHLHRLTIVVPMVVMADFSGTRLTIMDPLYMLSGWSLIFRPPPVLLLLPLVLPLHQTVVSKSRRLLRRLQLMSIIGMQSPLLASLPPIVCNSVRRDQLDFVRTALLL